ncbi:DUF4326 domain-containing protein [Phytohabitans houttuyneae]|uniref:DUF4326 domain-containing protein n=1 Tax=Phytohabitans houttuyneae TaxID=1076126 RepID=A0A6V8K313_9ACTN|nr:DUF4326 domain-containing protein [Phytohabitans houttuyneae]GFJ79533.1 hypothetical protein Phou_037130 [Phytohabitans houttuyneae]
MAQRLQLSRQKGWRMPTGAVVVARPTVWGSPFGYRTYTGLARVPALDGSAWEYEGRLSADGMQHNMHHADGTVTLHRVRYMTREEIVETYRRALCEPTPQLRLWHRVERRPLSVEDVRRELAGKDLLCWCRSDQPCHGDVLLAVARGENP